MPCVCVYRVPGLALQTRLDRSMPFEEADSRWPKDHVVDGDVDCCNLVITTARQRCGLVSNYFDLPLVLLVCAWKKPRRVESALILMPALRAIELCERQRKKQIDARAGDHKKREEHSDIVRACPFVCACGWVTGCPGVHQGRDAPCSVDSDRRLTDPFSNTPIGWRVAWPIYRCHDDDAKGLKCRSWAYGHFWKIANCTRPVQFELVLRDSDGTVWFWCKIHIC